MYGGRRIVVMEDAWLASALLTSKAMGSVGRERKQLVDTAFRTSRGSEATGVAEPGTGSSGGDALVQQETALAIVGRKAGWDAVPSVSNVSGCQCRKGASSWRRDWANSPS